MRFLVLLLLVSGAAAQNATDPADTGTPDTGTRDNTTGDPPPVDGDAWWAQRNVQWGLSGVAVVGLVAAFVIVSRR